MFRKRRIADGGGLLQRFLICLAFSALFILLLAFISALIVNSLSDPTKNLGIFSLVAMLLSALVSGVFCARMAKDKETQFTALVALAVVLIMLLINVIASGGKVSGGAFMNYGCYLGVATLSSLLGKKKGGHKRHKY